MTKSNLNEAATRLSARFLEGHEVGRAEVEKAAQDANVDPALLEREIQAALERGSDLLDSARPMSKQIEEHVSGGRYKGEWLVDLKSTPALNGHNLEVSDAPPIIDTNSVDTVRRVAAVKAKAELLSVPTIADLEALKVGEITASEVAAGIKQGLLSENPTAVKKAADTLRTAEAYHRKAAEDRENYADTGFYPMEFPELVASFNANETEALVKNIARARDPQTAGSMMLADHAGLVRTDPAAALTGSESINALWSTVQGEPLPATEHLGALDALEIRLQHARLPGSDGRESTPRDSFVEEWQRDAAPGVPSIEKAIRKTANANSSKCPFMHGNHAKGQSFGDGEFKLSKQAPDWARELIGEAPKSGVMMRISTSHSNVEDHDKEAAMTGVRLVIPIKGDPEEAHAQILDITANNGETTHAPTAAEHTTFTNNFSTPEKGIAATRPARIFKHLIGGIGNLTLGSRVSGIWNALTTTKKAMNQAFHEQDLYARHTLFMGGRYVQVRYEIAHPQNFEVADPNAKNGQTDAKAAGIKSGGLKINIYMKELPEGNPELVEQEGWQVGEEVLLATTTFNPQESDSDSVASKYFAKNAYIPGKQNMVARGAGKIARHRSPVYEASGRLRQQKR